MEEKVSKAILQEPIKFWIRTKGLLRMIGIKRIPFKIYPTYPGTMVKISPLIKKIDLGQGEVNQMGPIEFAYHSASVNAKYINKIIAYAILNGPVKIFLFGRLLSGFLMWRISSKESSALVDIIIESTDPKSFLTSIVSLKSLNVLSPKRETSPTGTGGIIAPGE